MYTFRCNMKCTLHCIHDTILGSQRSVDTVHVPSFNGSHQGRSGQKTVKKQSVPSRLAALQTVSNTTLERPGETPIEQRGAL